MTSPQTIQQLSDVQEIAAIRPRFGRAADARDFAAMEALFEPEVHADMSEFGIPAARLARADLVAMDSVTSPDAAATVRASWVVEAGRPGPLPA